MRRRRAAGHSLNLINGRSNVAVENNSSGHKFLSFGTKAEGEAPRNYSIRFKSLSDPLRELMLAS
jgi:hypothetical protein